MGVSTPHKGSDAPDESPSAFHGRLRHLSPPQPRPKSQQASLDGEFEREMRRRSPSPRPSPSCVSGIEAENLRIGRVRDSSWSPSERQYGERPLVPGPGLWRERLKHSWIRNKGLALVLLAQVFGTLMNVTTRLLEMEGNEGTLMFLSLVGSRKSQLIMRILGKGYHPFQVRIVVEKNIILLKRSLMRVFRYFLRV